jgi:hypothetical protein
VREKELNAYDGRPKAGRDSVSREGRAAREWPRPAAKAGTAASTTASKDAIFMLFSRDLLSIALRPARRQPEGAATDKKSVKNVSDPKYVECREGPLARL